MIINLHGFNSAGNNNTACQLRNYFEPEIKVISPSYTVHNFESGFAELHTIVAEAIELEGPGKLIFTGSSTGALFAEMLARKFYGKVVVINPVTNPEILKGLLGENENFRTGEKYQFTLEDFESFKRVNHDMSISRLILIDKGDPVINHARTRKFYTGYGRYIAFNGDSHRFTFWEEALPEIRALYNAESVPEEALNKA